MRPVITLLSAAMVLFLVMDPLGNILLVVTALRSVPVPAASAWWCASS
jgi:small neutral amino acid transporter SnatA (MarC family)